MQKKCWNSCKTIQYFYDCTYTKPFIKWSDFKENSKGMIIDVGIEGVESWMQDRIDEWKNEEDIIDYERLNNSITLRANKEEV